MTELDRSPIRITAETPRFFSGRMPNLFQRMLDVEVTVFRVPEHVDERTIESLRAGIRTMFPGRKISPVIYDRPPEESSSRHPNIRSFEVQPPLPLSVDQDVIRDNYIENGGVEAFELVDERPEAMNFSAYDIHMSA